MKMEIGGPDWSGWAFQRWGRAGSWRLFSPTGETYTAGEIQELRLLQADVDYLQGRLRVLERHVHALRFSTNEIGTLQKTIEILGRELPKLQRGRSAGRNEVLPFPVQTSIKVIGG